MPSSKESALLGSSDKDTIAAWPQVSHELICHLVEQFLAEHNYTSTLAAFEKEKKKKLIKWNRGTEKLTRHPKLYHFRFQ